MSFDWKTEETDWDKLPSRPMESAASAGESIADEPLTGIFEIAAERPGRPRWRILAFLIVALVLLISLAGVVYRQVERRLVEGRERAEADVLASYNIMRDAAQSGDTELFVGFLSGRDPQWSVAQAGLVSSDAYDNRSAFGFTSASSTLPSAAPTITLAPDLNSAEVSAIQAYEVALGMGLTETITLTQTATYRRGPDRWLLAPPDAEFWGDTEVINGRYARLSYPARDSAVIRRFSRDLEGILADLCGGTPGLCPPLTVNFSTNPIALSGRPQGTPDLLLPSPSLLGVPVDEAGYRAVSRRFATIVVDTLVEQYSGGACCGENLLYDSLRGALLNRLGLLSWQPTGDQMQSLLRDPAPLETVAALWESTGDAGAVADTGILSPFVDFLIRQAGDVPIVEMQRLLVENRGNLLWDWLVPATRNRYGSPADFERDWLEYATRTADAHMPAITLPAQDLQLICRRPGAIRASLYRYNFRSEVLEREHELAILDAPMLVGLPERDGVIVFGRNRRENGVQPYIWKNHQTMHISFGDNTVPGFIPLPPQPGSGSLTFLLDSENMTSPYAILPAGGCSDQDLCRTDTVIGQPVISPEQTRALFVVGASNPLTRNRYQALIYLGNGDGEDLRLIGNGWSPFWLDENNYGYITTIEGVVGQAVVIRSATAANTQPADLSSGPRRSNELLIAQRPNPMGGTTGFSEESASLETGAARILVTTSDMADIEFVPPGTSVIIDRVIPDNTREKLFIFTAYPLQPDTPGLAWEYNLDEETIVKRFEIDGEPFDAQRAYGFSRDGRWLVVGSRLAPANEDAPVKWVVYLHATDGTETSRFALETTDDWTVDWLFNWSIDSRWLAVTTGGYVRLIAPADDLSYPLVLDDLICTSAVWVNEITPDVR